LAGRLSIFSNLRSILKLGFRRKGALDPLGFSSSSVKISRAEENRTTISAFNRSGFKYNSDLHAGIDPAIEADPRCNASGTIG
jgi:hypothetical protein